MCFFILLMPKLSFRFYFDKDLAFLLQEERLKYNSEYLALRYAKSRLRMYANLFTRDVRKTLTDRSACIICRSKDKLQIDHKIPITKGGKNEIENTAILCRKCNRAKSNKI